MKSLFRFWPEMVAVGLCIVIAIWFGFWVSILIDLAWLVVIHGHVHVEDNSSLPIYFLGNYLEFVGPGHHFVLWPFVSRGDPIDTRYALTQCELRDANSDDKIIFTIRLEFAFRFVPQQIRDRQKAHELISSGPGGRNLAALEAARNAALYIVRRFTHIQLMTGTQQALIQGQIVQETAQRLAPAGMDILTTSFRVTFIGPQDLSQAYIQQQAAKPNAQGMVAHMIEVLDVLNNYGTSEIRQYLDLLMVRIMGTQNTDPLSALLAREWFNHSRGGSTITLP